MDAVLLSWLDRQGRGRLAASGAPLPPDQFTAGMQRCRLQQGSIVRRLAHTIMTVSAVTVAMAFTVGQARAAGHGAVYVVPPGQSIQAAVDAAQPGDTIVLQSGTYAQSVTISTDDITLQGAGDGPGGTLLVPPATPPNNFCASVPPEDFPTHGGGICVFGTFDPATEAVTHFATGDHISGIRLANWGGDGIASVATDDLTVDHVSVLNVGAYGMVHVLSKNGVISSNVISGATISGIYIGDLPNAPAGTFTDNDISKTGYGIAVNDSEGATVAYNNSHGNCLGYLTFDSGMAPPGGDNSIVAHNTFTANNLYCPPPPAVPGFPAVQGTGMLLAGATNTVVQGNIVTRNQGQEPLSGGIVLITSAPYQGRAESGDLISGNTAERNSPADVVWDGIGNGVVLTDNLCGTSTPQGLCG